MIRIKRLKYLRQFGIFQDFSWNNQTKDFQSRNIIYGWNYSGKTTLSRLFELLSSNSDQKTEFPIFRIDIDKDGVQSSIDNASLEVPIYVFNNDYIERNLHFHIFENAKIKGVLFDIGEESIDKREALNNAKVKVKEITEWLKTNIDAIDAFNNLNNIFTQSARFIKNDVFDSAIEFTRRHFQKEMSVLTPTNIGQYIITSPSELTTIKSNALQKNPMEEVSCAFFDLNLQALIDSVNSCIDYSPTIVKKEPLLDSDQRLNTACRDLVSFYNEHEEIDVCAFCGNPLLRNRISELNAYYSNEASVLRSKIEKLIEQINRSETEIETNRASFLSVNDLSESCRIEFSNNKTRYEELLLCFSSILASLKVALLEKLNKSLFVRMTPVMAELSFLSEYKTVCSAIRKVVEQHNSIISNFSTVKQNATNRLKLHYIATTLRENNYFRLLDAKNKQEEEREKKKHELEVAQQSVTLIQAELTSIIKGQERLNYYIQLMLGRKDLKIRATRDNYFELLRGTEIAHNLSEGEKSAIAFAYFLVFLEYIKESDGLSDAIIFIDDPISSLDNNHIAQVASLINKFFFYTVSDKTYEDFAQLFIATHNFEFFTFIRDANNLKRSRKNYFCPLYLLKRPTESSVELIDLPKAFSKYDSEYLYLFSEIYNYYISNCPEDRSYIMPNIIRRFLEIYTRIKLPGNHDEIDNRLKILTDGQPNELKFLHYFSHFTTLERAVKHSELILKMPDITADVIAFLQLDKNHYNSLVAGIS